MAASAEPGPVNLGNPQEVTMLELARRVLTVSGSDSPITFCPRPREDPTRRRPDISRARRLLGWYPRVDLDNGLASTVAAFLPSNRRSAAESTLPVLSDREVAR